MPKPTLHTQQRAPLTCAARWGQLQAIEVSTHTFTYITIAAISVPPPFPLPSSLAPYGTHHAPPPSLHSFPPSFLPSLPQFLLTHGAPIDDVDVAQRTALQWAIQYGRKEAVKVLLRQGAKVGHQDANRATVRREGGREAGREGGGNV